jgi:TPR repeat protein
MLSMDRDRIKQSYACLMCRNPTPFGPEESFRLVMKNAEKGLAWAQHSIGTKYEKGLGCQLNEVQAARWFKLAAAQGHPWSMASYGMCLQQGKGVQKSVLAAKKLYEQSASTGYPVAQYFLGELFLIGDQGVPPDPKEGVRWLRLGAEQGHDPSQCSLGTCYDMGDGLPRDLEQALYWHTKAGEQENITAMHNAGANLMALAQEKYGSVEITGKCPVPLALKWARRAATLGDVDSLRMVAQLEQLLSKACASCHKPQTAMPNRALLRCTKCKAMRYCSKECQVKHWKDGHKIDCCFAEFPKTNE